MGKIAQASSVSDGGKRVCGRSQEAFVARGTAEDWGGAAGQVGEGEGASEEGGVESGPEILESPLLPGAGFIVRESYNGCADIQIA
jgi:hypothetical protein